MKKVFTIVLSVALLAAGCAQSASTTPAVTPTPTSSPEAQTAPSSAEVEISETGYPKSEITLKKGGTLTIKNTGKKNHWPAAGEHTSHDKSVGTDKPIIPGLTATMTFANAGTYPLHDHYNEAAKLTVTVVE